MAATLPPYANLSAGFRRMNDNPATNFRRATSTDVAGPSAASSPENDDAPPSIGALVSGRAEMGFVPESWLKVVKANDDTILARDGGEGLKLYDALLDDDVAFSTLQQRRLAITSRDWEVAPGDDKDPRSVKAAEDFRAMLKALGFDRVTGLLHYAVWYGYAVGEAIWTTRQHDGRLIYWLDDIVVPDRRWFGFTMEGELRLTAPLAGGFEGEELPQNKFVTIRTGGSHDFAFYGLGLAHWVYWPIFFKRQALKFWALYLEKFGMPTVAIEFPEHEKDDVKARQERLQAAVAVGQDRAVLVPAGTLSDNKMQLIEAERSGAGSSSYKEFVAEQNEALMRVVLGQPGTSKGMSTGLNSSQGEVHKDVRDEIVKADADLISEGIHLFAKWVTRWNHGEDVAPPSVYRVLDDAEDLNTVAERDVKLDGIGIKRTENSVGDVYGDGYEVDRISEQEKADQAAALAAAKTGPGLGNAPAANNPAMLDFTAADEEAIDRLVAALVEDANPVFAAMGDELRNSLQGVTSAEGVRVALIEATERLDVGRLARMTRLPMLAERAGALVGAEDAVTA